MGYSHTACLFNGRSKIFLRICKYMLVVLTSLVFACMLISLSACSKNESIYHMGTEESFVLKKTAYIPENYPSLPSVSVAIPNEVPLLKGVPSVPEAKELEHILFSDSVGDSLSTTMVEEDDTGYHLTSAHGGHVDAGKDGSLLFVSSENAAEIIASICDITCDPCSDGRLSQYKYASTHKSQNEDLGFMSRKEAIDLTRNVLEQLDYDCVQINCVTLSAGLLEDTIKSQELQQVNGYVFSADSEFLSQGVYIVDFIGIVDSMDIPIYTGTNVDPVSGLFSVGSYASACVYDGGLLSLYISSNRTYSSVPDTQAIILTEQEAFDLLEHRLAQIIDVGNVEIIDQKLMYYTDLMDLELAQSEGFKLSPIWLFIFRQSAIGQNAEDSQESVIIRYVMDAYTGKLK